MGHAIQSSKQSWVIAQNDSAVDELHFIGQPYFKIQYNNYNNNNNNNRTTFEKEREGLRGKKNN